MPRTRCSIDVSANPNAEERRLRALYRTRMFLARAEGWEEAGRAHGELFGKILPASTMVVASLLNPKWRNEIEADACIPNH